MSLHAPLFDVIPEQTHQVARAAVPKGKPYRRMHDAPDPIDTNPTFAALCSPTGPGGGPSSARAPYRDAICRRTLGRAGGGCGPGAYCLAIRPRAGVNRPW